jgi:malate synthase
MILHPRNLAPASPQAPDLEVLGGSSEQSAQVLTPASLHFLARLSLAFESRRRELLLRRESRQAELDAGTLPDFLPETAAIRHSQWGVAPIPHDLQRRHVEITGPVDRKMIINALNSGADTFMADFEDSNSPTWENVIAGQANLMDAVRGQISYTSPEGKEYRLNEGKRATLMVRPRGWHLEEKNVLVQGQPMSASLFDFGLFFFHNAKALIERGTGPYFYLPKIESHLEARLWNDVFDWAQDQLNIPRGTIRATVLIETILAAFEMNEILYELRQHSAGLNCGRWDYIFSFIKKLRKHPRFILSDRSLVTMTTPFMRAYSLLLIKVCHRRGIHAIGGMAAQIPIRNDPAANEAAMSKVREDKLREATDGHDGTWVAHPGLVQLAREQFNVLGADHQISRQLDDVHISAEDLLSIPTSPCITEQGLRTNINVGIRYLESWLRGQGCVPINNLMEDAATAEISRAQLWQWVHHNARLQDGRAITTQLVREMMLEELLKICDTVGVAQFKIGRFDEARELFIRMTNSLQCPDFLTQAAYAHL